MLTTDIIEPRQTMEDSYVINRQTERERETERETETDVVKERESSVVKVV